jgi:hypothetical protein
MLEWHFETAHGSDASGVPDDNTPLRLIGRLLEKAAHFLRTDGQHLHALGRASARDRFSFSVCETVQAAHHAPVVTLLEW